MLFRSPEQRAHHLQDRRHVFVRPGPGPGPGHARHLLPHLVHQRLSPQSPVDGASSSASTVHAWTPRLQDRPAGAIATTTTAVFSAQTRRDVAREGSCGSFPGSSSLISVTARERWTSVAEGYAEYPEAAGLGLGEGWGGKLFGGHGRRGGGSATGRPGELSSRIVGGV